MKLPYCYLKIIYIIIIYVNISLICFLEGFLSFEDLLIKYFLVLQNVYDFVNCELIIYQHTNNFAPFVLWKMAELAFYPHQKHLTKEMIDQTNEAYPNYCL